MAPGEFRITCGTSIPAKTNEALPSARRSGRYIRSIRCHWGIAEFSAEDLLGSVRPF